MSSLGVGSYVLVGPITTREIESWHYYYRVIDIIFLLLYLIKNAGEGFGQLFSLCEIRMKSNYFFKCFI